MKAHYLGHVVFYVKDLQRSLAFYRDLLGFKEVGHIFNGAAAALTSGRTHHELLLIQVGDAPGPPAGRRRGLYHIGIKVGDGLDELRAAKKELGTGRGDHRRHERSYRQPEPLFEGSRWQRSGTVCRCRRVDLEKQSRCRRVAHQAVAPLEQPWKKPAMYSKQRYPDEYGNLIGLLSSALNLHLFAMVHNMKVLHLSSGFSIGHP